ncbi:type II glyceraldehyde-3-phosphate dehydrogenase [Candidatus Woesearchaeota archaeon]|nr:type II glyceraldehyde-3-phosphate dehydrogenase [Candidatus Woesearchaeota archaeon]
MIKVGVVGYGTIGKRVADAVRKQSDMQLIGVTGNSYSFRMDAAHEKNISIFATEEGKAALEKNGVPVAGTFEQLLDHVDIIVDCTPKKVGKEHKEKYYLPRKLKAVFQGGEKPSIAQVSFTAQCNYNDAINKDYVRVVSCNTTGLNRTLDAVHRAFGVSAVHATMIRRGADPWDIRHGPMNAIVPVLEMPSHHGPDVMTVLKDVPVFTTAVSVSTSLMHVHNIIADLKTEATVQDVLHLFQKTTRVRIVTNDAWIRSTAEIMEYARDLGRDRGDMPEICIWKEGIGIVGHKLFYMQAIHQESNVIPENIDAIRAMMGFTDAKKSIEMTNKSFGMR